MLCSALRFKSEALCGPSSLKENTFTADIVPHFIKKKNQLEVHFGLSSRDCKPHTSSSLHYSHCDSGNCNANKMYSRVGARCPLAVTLWTQTLFVGIHTFKHPSVLLLSVHNATNGVQSQTEANE